MRKSKDYSKDEYKDTTELEGGEETIDDMTEDELMAEDEDELVSEDENGLMAENEDELMAEDEGEDKDEFVAEDEGELLTEDENELLVEDEHVADEPVAEDEEEPRAEDDDGTRPEVPIRCSKRWMQSIKLRSRNKGDLFEEKLEVVKLVVQQISGKVALILDMWTASNSSSFLSLTIYYVDSSWKLKNFLLDIIPIEVRHSGYNMANAIMEVLCEFGLAEKTLALTTDNASSMITCGVFIVKELKEEFQNLDFAHYRYATHILNLAVNKGLNLISGSVKKVKGIEYLALELDVNTKWNSTFYMLEKWKRMEPALNLLATDNPNVRQRYLDDVDRVNVDR
ncbi:unnamed protein product [Rhizophagus irregularis]|nr:unnamed protein product [Rhizophagus irregularis]